MRPADRLAGEGIRRTILNFKPRGDTLSSRRFAARRLCRDPRRAAAGLSPCANALERGLRRRYFDPPGNCFCRVAIRKSDRRLVSYCYAQTLHADGGWSNAFLSAAIAKEHMLRKVWLRPRLWGWVAGRAYSSLFGRNANEGASLVVQPGWEVAKMLAVHPDVRGSNVGMDMMLDNEAEARRRGARRICGLIERGNIKAERLYASIGWVRTSDSGDKYRVFAMHKDL